MILPCLSRDRMHCRAERSYLRARVLSLPRREAAAVVPTRRGARSGELRDRDDHPDQHEHDDRDLCPDPKWRHGETAYLDRLGWAGTCALPNAHDYLVRMAGRQRTRVGRPRTHMTGHPLRVFLTLALGLCV